MAAHFSRSLRRLERDNSRRNTLAALTLLGLLSLWGLWLTRARITIYATSHTARIEVIRENQAVEAPVSGRVTVAPPVAGQIVQAGDILLQVDASPERLEQSRMLSRMTPSTRQLHALRDEIAALERALHEEEGSTSAALAESDAKARESKAGAEYAADEARRLQSLRASGIVSELDALRAAKLADQRKSEAETDAFAVSRVAREAEARREDRLARIARLHNEIAAIDGARGEALASSARLDYDIEQRIVRAPITGRVAESSTLKVGNLVKIGDRLCTIVPDGVLKVVAFFTPATAVGRVRPGQEARIRLEGFPWTQYGAAPARVSMVSGEVRDGKIRVELSLPPDGATPPLQHGLPAEVDVHIERVSPLAMVLRSAGERLRVNAAAITDTPDGQ